FTFACRVVKFSQKLYDQGGIGRVMVPQLVNCSTAVPAMLEEARAAESRRDFVSKCCIALKECRESHVRLRVIEACRLGPTDEGRDLLAEDNAPVAIIRAVLLTHRHSGRLV